MVFASDLWSILVSIIIYFLGSNVFRLKEAEKSTFVAKSSLGVVPLPIDLL